MVLLLDEDASDQDLVNALNARGIDAKSAITTGLIGASDEEQLAWATKHGRTIYTFKAKHFCKLHQELLRAGKGHGGIIIGQQQRYSVGEQLRRLITLHRSRSAAEMRNEVEFLSNWG
jgi:hypothetical protein